MHPGSVRPYQKRNSARRVPVGIVWWRSSHTWARTWRTGTTLQTCWRAVQTRHGRRPSHETLLGDRLVRLMPTRSGGSVMTRMCKWCPQAPFYRVPRMSWFTEMRRILGRVPRWRVRVWNRTIPYELSGFASALSIQLKTDTGMTLMTTTCAGLPYDPSRGFSRA